MENFFVIEYHDSCSQSRPIIDHVNDQTVEIILQFFKKIPKGAMRIKCFTKIVKNMIFKTFSLHNHFFYEYLGEYLTTFLVVTKDCF